MLEEEEVSWELFGAAKSAPGVQVITWQAVNGKNYFTPDVKLRRSDGSRLEPDLILWVDRSKIWLIEIKGLHSDSIPDERKLAAALREERSLLAQMGIRVEPAATQSRIRVAVAFGADDLTDHTACERDVVHLNWSKRKDEVNRAGLVSVLARLGSE